MTRKRKPAGPSVNRDGAIDYRSRIAAIRPFIRDLPAQWRTNRTGKRVACKLSPADKRKVSIAFDAVSRLLARGFAPVPLPRGKAAREKLQAATTTPRQRELRGKLKVAFAPAGTDWKVAADGSLVASSDDWEEYREPARFFPENGSLVDELTDALMQLRNKWWRLKDDELLEEDIDDELLEIIGEARRLYDLFAKNKASDRFFVYYWDGQSATFTADFLPRSLIVPITGYGEDGPPHVGIGGYRFRKRRDFAVQVAKIKEARRALRQKNKRKRRI